MHSEDPRVNESVMMMMAPDEGGMIQHLEGQASSFSQLFFQH